jgi:hypothetical protein
MTTQTHTQKAAVGQNDGTGMGGGTPYEVPVTQYQIPSEDVHDAICTTVAMIGSQVGKFGRKAQVILTFELTDEMAVFSQEKGKEPFTRSATLNLSWGQGAHLREIVGQWCGTREIETVRRDLRPLLGKPAQVQVIHKEDLQTGQVRARILVPEGVRAPRRGQEKIVPHNPLLHYWISDGRGGVFSSLPEWIQRRIVASEELSGRQSIPEEIAQRNMRQASENALAEAESDETNEPEEPDEAFDLDNYSPEDFRDESVVKMIRGMIENLPISNAEKINEFRRLNRLVHRAKANVLPGSAQGDGKAADEDEIPY